MKDLNLGILFEVEIFGLFWGKEYEDLVKGDLYYFLGIIN